MSIFKKFATPLIAVALVAVMGVSLITNTRTAHAVALTTATVTSPLSATIWNGTIVAPVTGANTGATTLTLSEPSITAWAAADTIAITHTGITSSTPTSCSNCTIAVGATTTTITITAVSATVTDTVSVVGLGLARTAVGVAGSVNMTLPDATVAGTITIDRMIIGTAAIATGCALPAIRAVASFSADSFAAGGLLCAWIADATTGLVVTGVPVLFTVSLGVVSTGTAKSTTSLSSSAGLSSTNYRGGGGIASTDTAIASNSALNVVSTISITVTSPTGNTASKLAITAPTNLSVSPTQTNVSPGYVSTKTSTNLSVQVTDAAGLGVNSQTLLITTDKGALVQGFGATCGTSKAVTSSSSTLALTSGGETKAGVVQLTFCGNQTDAAGTATITVSNVSTSMANATTTVSTAGRPAKVEATYSNGVISATVKDANGNNVSDDTPVQFTISSQAGAVSNACNLSSNGKASSAVSLNTGSGSVIVSAGYNESGTAANCGTGATGSQSVSTVVTISGNTGTTTGGTPTTTPPTTTPPAAGAGGFNSTPVLSASGLGNAILNAGTTVAVLDSSLVAGKFTGAWAQDSKGVYAVYIVNGGFVNDAFKAAFPDGFKALTAVQVVGK